MKFKARIMGGFQLNTWRVEVSYKGLIFYSSYQHYNTYTSILAAQLAIEDLIKVSKHCRTIISTYEELG